jgi:hypothetical protein
MQTRDMTTGPQDGPLLTQFEADNSRKSEAPQNVNNGGQAEAEEQRPHFSPVAQPGMVESIHWHTVETREPEHKQEQHGRHTLGMIGRFHQRPKSGGKHG